MLIRKADVAKLREQMKPKVKRICKNCGKVKWIPVIDLPEKMKKIGNEE